MQEFWVSKEKGAYHVKLKIVYCRRGEHGSLNDLDLIEPLREKPVSIGRRFDDTIPTFHPASCDYSVTGIDAWVSMTHRSETMSNPPVGPEGPS